MILCDFVLSVSKDMISSESGCGLLSNCYLAADQESASTGFEQFDITEVKCSGGRGQPEAKFYCSQRIFTYLQTILKP